MAQALVASTPTWCRAGSAPSDSEGVLRRDSLRHEARFEPLSESRADTFWAARAHEVGVRLRASGLDAFGLVAAQRIAPDELLDGLGPHLQGEGVIEKASSTGRKSRFETGSVTDGGTKTGRGSAGGKGAAGFVTVVTGCAGIRVADGVTSSMRTLRCRHASEHELRIRGGC